MNGKQISHKKQKSSWLNHNPKDFIAGDIICNRAKQDFLRLVIYTNDDALWVTGLVHCAFAEHMEQHPIYPIYFEDLENGIYEPLLKLGNLNDYQKFLPKAQEEIKNIIHRTDKNTNYEINNHDIEYP